MDLSVKAHELATKLTSIQRLLNQFGPRHQGTRTQADSKEYWLLQKQNILLSSLWPYFFLEVNTFLLVEVCGVAFHCLRLLSSGSVWLFRGFYRRCCGNANNEEAGFNLVGSRPPLKWTEHTCILASRRAAIHCMRRSRSDIPAA